MMKSIQIFAIMLLVATAFTAVPRLISFQASLTNPDGVPYHDVDLEVIFKIYTSETGLAEVWDETHDAVSFDHGVCSVILGSVEPISLRFDTDYWLELEVDGEVMSPRYRMTSSPYALRADYADTAVVSIYAMEAVYAEMAGWAETADEAEYADRALNADTSNVSYLSFRANNASLADTADHAYTADAVAWDDITGMPAGFADGVDNTGSGGGSYTAGAGLDIESDVISIANSGVTLEMLSDMGASDGQILKYVAGVGWTVDEDETGSGGTSYTAGEGIDISGDEISIADGAVSLDKISTSGSYAGQIIKNVGGTLMWAEDEEGSGTGTGDDWGDDVVITDASMTGNGTPGLPLQVAAEGINAYHLANDAVGYVHIQNDAVHLENIDNSTGLEGQVLKIQGGSATWADDSTYADGWGMDYVHVDGAGLIGIGTTDNPLYIGDYSLQPLQIDPSDADPGQILKFDAGLGYVVWADDETSSGGPTDDGDWTIGGGVLSTMDYVGIGTTPAERLHIYDATGEARVLIESASHSSLLLDAPATADGRIIFTTGGSRNGSIQWNGPDGGIAFYNGPESAAPDMFLGAPGWLGLGTDAPTEMLHVTGNVRIDGDLSVGGSYPGGGSGGVGGSGTDNYLARWDGTGDLNASRVQANDDGSISIETATDGGYVARFINTGTGIKSGVYAIGTGGIGVYGSTSSDVTNYSGVTGYSSGNASGIRGIAGTGLAGKFVGDVDVDDDLYVGGEITTGNHTSPAVPVAFGVINEDGTIDNATSNVIAVTQNPTYLSYEVTISGETIHFSNYVMIANSLESPNQVVSCSSTSGHAYFTVYDVDAHSRTSASFSFVIYKL